jgi:hypothetical protein
MRPPPLDHKPIDVLKNIVCDDRKQWGDGPLTLSHKGGVCSVLLKVETEMCDPHQCYAWVHSSMAGYLVFRKAGLKEIGRLEVNLDDYADGIK